MIGHDVPVAGAAVDGSVTLESLANFNVVRDLVVDLDPFWDAVEKALPWLVPDPAKSSPEKGHEIIPNDDFIGLGKIDACVLCAACHSDCPVVAKHRDFPGPAFNVKTARFILDERDFDRGRAARALDLGTGFCETAKCPVECPKEIDLNGRVVKVIKSAAGK